MKIFAFVLFAMISLGVLFAKTSESGCADRMPFSKSENGAHLGISGYGYLLDDDAYFFNGECKVFCGFILVD